MRNDATLERDQEQGKPARIHEQGAEIYQEQDETSGQTAAQTVTPAPLQKWISTAGPRQTSDTLKALKKLTHAGGGTLERRNYGDFIVSIMVEDTPEEAAHRAQVHEVLNAIHAKHGGTITAANCRAIIADCAEAFPSLEASRPVRDERQTPEQEAAEKAARALIHATANAKHKEAEAIRQTAADEEAAKPEHAGLLRTPTGGHAGGVHVAKNIRFILKKNFPGQTFSVTADYNSCRIAWSNGPTVDEVEKHVKEFQEGHFDGMDDSYHFRHSAFLDAFGGVQYVFPERRVSDDVRAAVDQEIRKHRPECLEHEIRTETHRALVRASMYNKGAFTGLDIVEGRLQAVFAELPAAQTIPATDKDRQGPALSSASVRIEEHTHTKKGFQMWIVILADRLDAAEFQALTATARAAGGWYSRAWGQTPGGFAFKDQGTAETFAASISGQTPPPNGTDGGTEGGNRGKEAGTGTGAANGQAPRPASSNGAAAGTAARLRALGDGLTVLIEDKRRPMTQNATPKRTLQYRARTLEADDLERAQTALYRLADGHEAGTLPDILKGYNSKAAILEAVQTVKDHSGGYYSLTDTGRFRDSSAPAKALQALISAQTPEEAGAAADRKREQTIKNKILDLAGCKIPGFFVTPQTVGDRVIEEADINPGDEVLEPSAGTGNLADLAAKAGGKVACVEVRSTLCEILELKGYIVTHGDFLDQSPFEWNKFDKIIMNPPFEKGADADHVRHAFNFLKPGGRLVAVMGEGTFFRSDFKAEEFRAWLCKVGGISEKLPDGSFKSTGEITDTGTATRLVIIHK